METRLNGTPKKPIDLSSSGYVKWSKDDKTWLAEWLLEHREYFNNSSISDGTKYGAILTAISISRKPFFPKRKVMTVDMIRSQLKTLRKNYLKYSDRLNSSGEVLIASE